MRYLTLCIILFCSVVFAAEPPPGTQIVHPIDGAIMVYVPSGEFLMGIDRVDGDKIAQDLGFKDYTDLWAWDAFPKRTVVLNGFFIDRTEITVEQWRKFDAAIPNDAKGVPDFDRSEKPADQLRAAGGITWAHAQKYANWAGKMLPTDEQWEKAARGTDGRLYPWGNDGPTAEHLLWKLDKAQPLVPHVVGQYPKGASPYGALDMLGNEYEWTTAWMESYPNNPEAAKMLPYTGHQNATVRGGSTYHGPIGYYASKRSGFPLGETHFHIGFRTVWEPSAGYFESPEFQKARDAVTARSAELETFRKSIPTATTQPIAK